MAATTRRRVAIGGTFACDEALAVPLQYLLIKAVWNVDVELQWLRYGSLTDFDEWASDVLHPAHPVDLVLLLVRLSDLEAAHPELQLARKNDEDVGAGAVSQFTSDLERYDAMATTAPLVVLLCPSPSATTASFDAQEQELHNKIDAMHNVSMQSSGQLLGLFQQQYTTAFYDAVGDKRQHSPYTHAMLNVLSFSLSRQICRLFRSASSKKKVIVLDCDNTLWGGAVAEVGPSGIDLAPRFIALQRFVVAQQQRGMLLALCSKNILDDVVQAFEQRRGDMVLDMDKHVVATKVNWQPKSENIKQLAKELSLGLDSFLFIDDNPLECNEVATALPSVTVITLGTDFSESFLDHEWVFDEALSPRGSTTAIGTSEDSQRTQLYQQNLQREQLRESSSTHKAFLSALGVKIVFEELDRGQERSSSFTRALQLHHRTNQFSTATTFAKRLEEDDLMEYVAAPDRTVICAHVTDRFGHYGIVSAALCRRVRDSNVLRVDSFLLSCRALNRGVEHAMMRKLCEIATRTSVTQLEFIWEPTERNQPVHAFFSALSNAAFVVESNPQHHAVGGENRRLSSSNSGVWVISVDKARQVSFLKTNNTLHRHSGGLTDWLLHTRPAYWLRDTAFSIIRWMLSYIALPQCIARLMKPALVQRLGGIGLAGVLQVSLRDRGSLERFLSPALSDIRSENSIMVSGAGSTDSNDDDKFRRKARHQTKLALVNHIHEEASRVIWSANRPHSDVQAAVGDGLSREMASDDTTGSTPSLQLVCKSPKCSATVQCDSRCAFQQCRNCCYRIQRFLTRSLHHANADARQSAVNSLQAEFNVVASLITKEQSDPGTKWCAAHQNKRRRREAFK